MRFRRGEYVIRGVAYVFDDEGTADGGEMIRKYLEDQIGAPVRIEATVVPARRAVTRSDIGSPGEDRQTESPPTSRDESQVLDPTADELASDQDD